MLENISLYQRANTSCLKSFSISSLFGSKDVNISFEKETLILIAENGCGKTTILNILYYLLSGNYGKLRTIDFQSVKLEFASGESIEFHKDDLRNLSFIREQSRLISEFSQFLPLPLYEIDRLNRYIEEGVSKNVLKQYIREREIKYQIPFSLDRIEKIIEESVSSQESSMSSQEFNNKRETIDNNLKEQILYFPTYRRIEEDLKNLGYAGVSTDYIENNDERLIQFGMDDVVNRFAKIQLDIRNSIVDSFSKLSGEILTQFVEGITTTPEMKENIKPDVLKIVLSRVGDKNISSEEREKIQNLVATGEIHSSQYDQLIYFLSKLISVYEQQKDKDESIKKFTNICNNYLKNKKIVYDETTVNISIVDTKNNKPIDIVNLSSGEKQIISIFSKMYLDYSSNNNFIVLFDEPELSLSIEWQKMLLPDILHSGKCKLLLAVTHSPFIFDNDLDLNAYDLDIFVTEGSK